VLSAHDGTTFLLGDIARAAGLAPGDFQVMAVGGAPTRWKLLREDKIDVGLQPFPLSYAAEAAGFSNLGPVAAIIPDYLFSMMLVEDGFAQANRATIVAALRALRRGSEFMFAEPAATAAIAAEELETSAEFARRALADAVQLDLMSRDLGMPEAALARVFRAVAEAGLVPPGIHFERNRVVDESYLRESRLG